jgi:hypothetical protein
MDEPLALIEINKSGTLFVARSTLNGVKKEYKNQVLEDMLTELVVDLQEDINE